MTKFGIAVTALAVALTAGSAAAQDFSGKSVRGTYEFPTQGAVVSGPQTAVVGAGVEFSNYQGLDIDFTSAAFTVTDLTGAGFSPGTFNGLHFFDVNSTIGQITGVTRTSGTTGFTPTVTFDANNIFLNFAGLGSGAANRSATYTVTFAAAAVPEPASWAMMIGGFGVVGGAMRRRTSVARRTAIA